PEGSVGGPSIVTRLLAFVAVLAAVFLLQRRRLEREGQGPGKYLFALRVENGKVVEDAEGLDLLERVGTFTGRFARPLLLALSSLLVVALWGGAQERSVVEARQRQLLHRAYILDAEHGCCSSPRNTVRGGCPRMLEIWAAIADQSDGTGDIPGRDFLL